MSIPVENVCWVYAQVSRGRGYFRDDGLPEVATAVAVGRPAFAWGCAGAVRAPWVDHGFGWKVQELVRGPETHGSVG